MAQSFNDIIKSINNGVDANYSWAVRERKDIYHDRWEYIIRNALSDIFNTDVSDGLKCLVTGEMNLLKRTINTVSSIYTEEADRKLIIGEDENGEAESDEVYNDLIKSVPYDLIMRKANQMTNLTNATAIRTVWRDGQLDYDILNFDSLQVITDPYDWKKVIGYCFYIGASLPAFNDAPDVSSGSLAQAPQRSHPSSEAEHTQYQSAILYTTDDEYFEEKYRGKIIHFDQRKGGGAVIATQDGKQRIEDNPYKGMEGESIMPFTLITKDYPVDTLIDYSTGNDLVYLAINTAVRYVHMNNMFANQSWKQPYVISDVPLPEGWNGDPRTTLRIPTSKTGNQTSIGLLDMQADLQSQWNVIVEMIKVGLAQYGIDAQSLLRSGGNPESGFSLQIRKEGLDEIRKGQLPIYESAEHDIFEKTRIVYNYHAGLEGKPLMSTEGEFNVDFADPQRSSDQTEEDAHWATLIRENVKSRLDWIKSENPDIKTDEDAELVLKNNQAVNNRLSGMLEPVSQPEGVDDTEVVDDSEGV